MIIFIPQMVKRVDNANALNGGDALIQSLVESCHGQANGSCMHDAIGSDVMDCWH